MFRSLRRDVAQESTAACQGHSPRGPRSGLLEADLLGDLGRTALGLGRVLRVQVGADGDIVAHVEAGEGLDDLECPRQTAAGTQMRLNPTSFREAGDEVVVDGSIRVARPAGGFSESQISWTYRFREGRLAAAGWSPRQAA